MSNALRTTAAFSSQSLQRCLTNGKLPVAKERNFVVTRPQSAFLSSKTGNRIAVITLSRPALGRLSQEFRAELYKTLSDTLNAPEIDAIVLASHNEGFNLDLPLAERQLGESAPSLDALTDLISEAPKPVVAALRGRIANAGAELALAAQGRVVHRASLISIPSLRAGQLPCAAACYTLAAKLGPQSTIRLLETLADISVTLPQIAPLFDKVVGQNVVGEAAGLAKGLHSPASETMRHTPAFSNPRQYQSELEALRNTAKNLALQPEKAAAIAMLEAAHLLPKEAAYLCARAQGADLAHTTTAKSKTYKRAARLASLHHLPECSPPASLSIVGTGKQALTLTLMALQANFPVTVLALKEDAYEAFHKTIKRELDNRVARRILPISQADKTLSLLSEHPDFASLSDAECIIECAPQPAGRGLASLHDLLNQIKMHSSEKTLIFLTSAVRSGAAEFLAQMTDKIAALQIHPDIGSGDLAEIALAPEFAHSVEHQAPMHAALKRLGVPSQFQTAQNGLASSRLFTAFCLAAEEAVAQGASPERVDQAQLSRVKPFAAQNAEGHRAQPFRLHAFFEDSLQSRAPGLNAAFLQMGLDGGKGTSAFEADTVSLKNEAKKAVEQWRRQIAQTGYNPPPAPPSPDDIRFLTTAALYVEGEKLLKAGIVATPWEIDQLTSATLGLAPQAAGPFFEIASMGLASFLARLKHLKPLRPEFFTAAPHLSDMIKNGETFAKPGQGASSHL